MTILFDSSWIEKGQITDQMLFLAKKVPEIKDLLMKEKLDPIQRSFLGLELIDPNITSNLEDDIRIAKSFVQNGGAVEERPRFGYHCTSVGGRMDVEGPQGFSLRVGATPHDRCAGWQ